jgi:arylsulfatase A-like enzyme
MRRILFLRTIALVFVFARFVALVPQARAEEPAAPVEALSPTVVMISMDGTRPADLTGDRLPALVDLASRGARAERLIPSFPTNTFPNHVTLVTGVAPERHGIVDNTFVDPELGLFDKKDIPKWIQSEPLWSLVERSGIVSASYYWVGSEGEWPGGRAPRYWKPFSGATGEREKVAQMLAWLDLPEPDRPHLITSWFHGADHAGHHHGPDSAEAKDSLRAQNAALETLLAGIEERGLWPSTTLLVVSDHGMMVPEQRVDLGVALAKAGLAARVIGIGGFVSVRVQDSEAARAVEVARELGLSAWRREDAPERLRVSHPRFGPVVVVAPRGTAVVYEGLVLTGFHGHEPDQPEMSGVLVASGRGIVSGARLGAVHNVDVAPTVLALLGVEVPAWMEGRPIEGLLAPIGTEGQVKEGGP